MKDKVEAAIKSMIANAKKTGEAEEAVKWSHAATNIAYAYATFNSVPSPPAEPAPSAE